ncbi:MAG: NADPH-dependent F420 reductase [Acidiferrobacteraceae bacterium]
MQVAVLGTGKMGTAVGRRLARAGHAVIYGSRTPDEAQGRIKDIPAKAMTYEMAARAAECAIIAVPWAAVIDLMARLAQPLSGKVVIDLTNPLSPDMSSLVVGGTDSAAEQVARALPGSTVVKALNSVTADNFADPDFSGAVAQMFYCGNDPVGGAVVRELIEACGYRPVGCGALSNARYLEAMAMFWLQLAFWEDWGSRFRFELAGRIP